MSELRLIVLKKDGTEELPNELYKILISPDRVLNVNPKTRTYTVGKPFELSIEGKVIKVHPEDEVVEIGGENVYVRDPVTYIILLNGDVCWESYSSIETFRKKYGIT